MRFRKTMAVLGLVGAVVAAAIAGTAFAQTPTPTPGQGTTNYRDVFMDKLAAALGTTRDKLNAACTQARNDTVDQEVKDGKLTQQQADKIKSSQGDAPFGFGFGTRGGDRGQMPGKLFMGGADVMNAVAQALGMTPQDLMTQLRSGKTLADLAGGKEQAVKDAIVNTVKPKLDQAVKDGKLTQEREDQAISSIQSSDLKNLGEFGGFGGRGEMGRGRGNGNNQNQNQNRQPGNSSFHGPASQGASAL